MSEPALLERLAAAGAATVHEAAGRRGDLDPRIHPISASGVLGGTALPVECHPGDNLAVHRAVAAAKPGDVLVVDGAGVMVGYLGDILAEASIVRGIRGLVIDGGVRDVGTLRQLGFPVWATGPAMRGAAKLVPGRIGEPVVCGGVAVAPGDLIVADEDGVVAVPAALAEAVADAADAREASERTLRERLRGGELTLDLLDLRAPLG